MFSSLLIDALIVGAGLAVILFVSKSQTSRRGERLGHDVVPPPGGSWSSTIYTASELLKMEKPEPPAAKDPQAHRPPPPPPPPKKRGCSRCGRSDCPNAN